MIFKKNKGSEKTTTPKVIDDRLMYYFDRELRQSPKRYFREVRLYWIFGLVLNFVGMFYMGMSINNVLTKNANSTLNLVRVDGARVEEAFDIRREILLKNSLQRASVKEEKQDK